MSIIGDYPQYARVKVVDGPLTSFPIVERVYGGWQSGVMFYPDALVESYTALDLVPPTSVFRNPDHEWGIDYYGINTYESEEEARKQLFFAQSDVPAKLVRRIGGLWVDAQ